MTDDKQRAMMAADLAERGAAVFRSGSGSLHGAESAFQTASYIRVDDEPEFTYRRALKWLGLTPDQIDAAVSAIQRGEWPADSLPGRLKKMRDDRVEAAREDAKHVDGFGAAGLGQAMSVAYENVLILLGVKP